MWSIFSCACWPSVCLLWRNVYHITFLKWHLWNDNIFEMEVRAAFARGQGKEGRGKEMGVSRIPRLWKFTGKWNFYQKNKIGETFPKYKTLISLDSTIPCLGTYGQTNISTGRCLNKDVDCSVCVWWPKAKEPLNVHPEETVKSRLVHPISRGLYWCYKG